jgi:hypothetical protein
VAAAPPRVVFGLFVALGLGPTEEAPYCWTWILIRMDIDDYYSQLTIVASCEAAGGEDLSRQIPVYPETGVMPTWSDLQQK